MKGAFFILKIKKLDAISVKWYPDTLVGKFAMYKSDYSRKQSESS